MASKNHLKQRLDPHKQEKYLGTERSPSPLPYVLAGVALLTGLFALSRTHYLLFHNLTELFSIAVAWSRSAGPADETAATTRPATSRIGAPTETMPTLDSLMF